MMMNDKSNLNNEMNELNLDELETVDGGGIKEVAAAVTLAAMAATGAGNLVGTVSALAESADANSIIEEAPAQDAYGAEFDGAIADGIAPLDEASEPAQLKIGRAHV